MSTSNFNSNNFLSDFMITLKNTYSVIKNNLFLILINNNKKGKAIMTTFLIFVIVNRHRKIEPNLFHAECVMDLYWQSELLIFELILNSLNPASFLEATGAVLKIGLSIKPNHHQEI